MKDAKSTLNYLIGRPVRGYWAWWTGELMSAIPVKVRQLLFNSNKIVFEIDGDDIDIYKTIGNKKNHVTKASINELSSGQINKIIAGSNITEKIVVIPRHHVLEKKVTFPTATEENIREVLSFEMDRLTPFTSAQVYYDYYLLSRDKIKNTIELNLIVIPKDRIDGLLARLKKIGMLPHVITINNLELDRNISINLLPATNRAKKINTLKIINYTLSGILLVLILVSLFLPVFNKIQIIENLQPELESYQKRAESIIKLRQQVEKAEEEALYLTEKKRSTFQMLEIIDELTQIIPDDTWVNQLEVNDSEVHIHGESISSASLLPMIEASNIFSDARFRSPVTQNRQNNTERFHLSAQIKQEELL